MIDRLEKAGLVERKNNPEDRRGTLVTINQEAVIRVGSLFFSARVAQNKLLDGYTRKELETLAEYFEKSAAMFEEERLNILKRDVEARARIRREG